MSYWHNDSSDVNARSSGKRMLSQYTLGRTQLAATGQLPTHFHNASDVEHFYPNSTGAKPAPVRRTKPGGENVRRTAALNDTLQHQLSENRASQQQQQLSVWHAAHESKNRAGARRREATLLEAEVAEANAEVKLLRRAKLRHLLEAEQQQYKRELAEKGLAILYDEP